MQYIVLRSFLKQRAAQLQKEKHLAWHKALDEAAKEFGYPNYKNYKNILEYNHRQFMSKKMIYLNNISSENNMSKKMGLAASFIKDNLIPFTDLVWILKPFQNSDALQSVCEQANLKNDIKTCILDDFLSDDGKIHIEAFHHNYKAKDLALVNLSYDMNEGKICINGLYELIVEFNSEASNANYIDHSLFGTFVMTIDHTDIGMEYTCDHSFDGMCHVGSKNYFNYNSH